MFGCRPRKLHVIFRPFQARSFLSSADRSGTWCGCRASGPRSLMMGIYMVLFFFELLLYILAIVTWTKMNHAGPSPLVSVKLFAHCIVSHFWTIHHNPTNNWSAVYHQATSMLCSKSTQSPFFTALMLALKFSSTLHCCQMADWITSLGRGGTPSLHCL